MMANHIQSKSVANGCGCNVLNDCNVHFTVYSVRVWGMGRDRSVCKATCCAMDDPRIESLWVQIFVTPPDLPWGPLNLLYCGYRVFPGVRRPGVCVDHPPLAARLKKEYSYTSNPLWSFLVCTTLKFTCTITGLGLTICSSQRVRIAVCPEGATASWWC
jgi:hypothetical protein